MHYSQWPDIIQLVHEHNHTVSNQASVFLRTFIHVPHYNIIHVRAFDSKTPAGVIVIPGDSKSSPLKQNTSDCTPSSWFSTFSSFVWFSIHFHFLFRTFFHSAFYPMYLYFPHFPSEFILEKISRLVFLVICDLLLNSKSSGFFSKVLANFMSNSTSHHRFF